MAWLFQAQTATRGIQLGNEEFGHTIAIGTNWTKVRIGGRFMIQHNQSFDGQTYGNFVLGMCQGTANMFKSPNCTEFLGFRLGNSSIPSYTFATSPGPHFFNGRPDYISKVGTTITAHTGFSASEYFSGLNSVRTQFFVDLQKNGGSSWTVTAFCPGNTTQATTDNGYPAFIANMEGNTTPTNTSLITATAVTHPGPGLLDTVYVGWGKSMPPLTVLDLCVARVL